MTALLRVKISGTGSAAPARVLTNDDLSRMVDTSDEWILTRTGIRERRVATSEQASSDIGTLAARRALEAAGVDPKDLDLVICCTLTPDYPMPNTGALIARNLGASDAGACDLNAACSGFLYGLATARQFVATGASRKCLVVGAEIISKVLNWEDRNTCIIFGDGAGAAVFEVSEGPSDILATHLGAKGDDQVLTLLGGGSRFPASRETVEGKQHTLRMQGRETFKFAVNTFVDETRRMLRAGGLTIDDLAYLVPHQVNARIIDLAAEKLGMPMERVMVNIDRYGNTSAASVPLALDELIRSGRVKRGDYLVLLAFGGGLTWASALVRY